MSSQPAKEIETEILPFVRRYKDGSVERLQGSPPVPPSPHGDPKTGVLSKDVTISSDPAISARIFLPPPESRHGRLPVLVYFHGGGFFFESAFSSDHHRLLNSLVALSSAVAVSVEYRLAPEHPLPAAYLDCLQALSWVASHASNRVASHASNHVAAEPWLAEHADFNRVFLGGDSAGANIVHNVAMMAGVGLRGSFLTHPYFLGPGLAADWVPARVWGFVYPDAPGGLGCPMINPTGPGAPSLAGAGLGARVLVSVAEKDDMRELGLSYCHALRESGFGGEVEIVDVEGEDHAFHILSPHTRSAEGLIKRLADFLLK